MKKLFTKKGLYIVLIILFSLILAADAAVAAFVPTVGKTSDFSGNMPSGGGMPGGFSGEMPEGFDGEMPEGFDGEMPEGFDGEMPEGFDGEMPEGFDGEMPEGFDGEMPEGFNGEMPEGFDGEMPEGFSGEMPESFGRGSGFTFLSGVKKLWVPIAVVCVLADAFCIFMLIRIKKRTVGGDCQKKEIANGENDQPAKRKKRKIFPFVSVIVLVAALIIMLLPKSGEQTSVEIVEELKTAEVTLGTISEQLITGGSLADTNTENIALAGNIKVTSWSVSEGDYVEEGQLIAEVDEKTVLSAIADINDSIKELDADLQTHRSDTVSSTVTAPVAGRVKAIYVEKGSSVMEAMYENSALIRLSLDGRLSVEIPAGELSAGTNVNVVLSDGEEIDGTVYDVSDGVATVTVADSAADYLDSAEVFSELGNSLGTGELKIHSEVIVTGYAGTVSAVNTKLNAAVSEGDTLITLSEYGFSGNYNILSEQRTELEAQLDALFEILQNGGIYAPCAGRISSINDDILADNLSSDGSGFFVSLLADFGGMPEGGMPEGNGEQAGNGEQVEKTVEFYGIVKEILEAEDGKQFVVTPISEGSEMTVKASELEGKLTNASVDDIKQNDILSFTYLESGELLSVTRYSKSSGSSSSENITVNDGGYSSFGGMTYSTEEEEEDDTLTDYSMAETDVCTIVLYETAEITAEVDELDIMSLSVGQSADVLFEALPGQHFSAVISEIDTEGENSGGNTKFSVTFSLDRTAQMLAGMNASVYVPIETHENVLTVTSAAICEDSTGIYVYTAYDEKNDVLSSPVYVTTGVSDGENTEILSGLEQGSTVYYKYAETLKYTFTV